MMNLNDQMVLIVSQIFNIQQTKYINKKYEILTATRPIYVYINGINNRLVFKIKRSV